MKEAEDFKANIRDMQILRLCMGYCNLQLAVNALIKLVDRLGQRDAGISALLENGFRVEREGQAMEAMLVILQQTPLPPAMEGERKKLEELIKSMACK